MTAPAVDELVAEMISDDLLAHADIPDTAPEVLRDIVEKAVSDLNGSVPLAALPELIWRLVTVRLEEGAGTL